MKEDKVQDIFSAIMKLKPEEKEQLDSRLKQAEKDQKKADILGDILHETKLCLESKYYRNNMQLSITIEKIETLVNDLKD